MDWKISFLLGLPIFRGYVKFLGCSPTIHLFGTRHIHFRSRFQLDDFKSLHEMLISTNGVWMNWFYCTHTNSCLSLSTKSESVYIIGWCTKIFWFAFSMCYTLIVNKAVQDTLFAFWKLLKTKLNASVESEFGQTLPWTLLGSWNTKAASNPDMQ